MLLGRGALLFFARRMGMGKINGFLECEGTIRFQVSICGETIDTILSWASCEAAHGQAPSTKSLTNLHRQRRSMQDGIVLDKVVAGER